MDRRLMITLRQTKIQYDYPDIGFDSSDVSDKSDMSDTSDPIRGMSAC